jgi:hypothetical protein
MKFEYKNKDGSYRYEFHFRVRWPHYVDIVSYQKGYLGCYAWMHQIKDRKIIWRNDNDQFLHLSDEAKEYISKIILEGNIWWD